MHFGELLAIVGKEPVFETGLLLAGAVKPDDVRRQLSRWTASGRIWQLRRGLYTLAPPYQKTGPHPFLAANWLVPGSYVSLQSALGYYGLIPESVPTTTSVTLGRGGAWRTPIGTLQFRHIHRGLFHGYRQVVVGVPGDSQAAYVATPEKALLDLVHLQPGGDARTYLDSLRLQHLERMNQDVLLTLAGGSASPKLKRAAAYVAEMAKRDADEYELL